MKQATHFIEQIKYPDGSIASPKYLPIRLLEWSLNVNKNINVETIAVFKVYPHPKPVIAEFDKEVNAIIIE